MGYLPQDVAINTVTNRLLVARILAFSATLIDGATNTVMGTVSTRLTVGSAAANPATSRFYVGNAARVIA